MSVKCLHRLVILCGFVRHVTCTPENIIFLIYSGCFGIPVLHLNRKSKCVFNLFVPRMLLISHGFFFFFWMLSQLMETFKSRSFHFAASLLILLQARSM